jgi:hypothetical protein
MNGLNFASTSAPTCSSALEVIDDGQHFLEDLVLGVELRVLDLALGPLARVLEVGRGAQPAVLLLLEVLLERGDLVGQLGDRILLGWSLDLDGDLAYLTFVSSRRLRFVLVGFTAHTPGNITRATSCRHGPAPRVAGSPYRR